MQVQKDMSEGSNLTLATFYFLVDEGREDQIIARSRPSFPFHRQADDGPVFKSALVAL